MSSDEDEYKRRGILESNGSKHEVEFSIENNDTLVVQVENCHTHDQWVGKYDSSYIEELSHKTGNFKQFEIFCNMLESSLSRNSDSVMLDILSYEDLKVLREQKLGAKSRKVKEKTDKLQMKRYLIMTYTVEFDQIHYPLPLTYTGTSNSLNVNNKMKQLQDEQENVIESDEYRCDSKNNVNKTDFKKLVNENKQLRDELNECRKYMKELGSSGFAKELKVLKKVIQNLETDLLREKTKHQHAIAKKKKEFEKLLEEFEDLKANERNYRVRCESLTEELAIMKRNSRSGIVTRPSRHNSSGSSLRNNRNTSRERGRPTSNSHEPLTKRTTSRERSASASSFRRTPSPGVKRFDPSAYVREKERKKKDNEINRSGGRRMPSNGRRTPSSVKKTTPVSYKPPASGSKARSSAIANRKNRSSSLGSDAGSIINTKAKKRHSSERSTSRRNLRSDTSDDEYYERKNYSRPKERPSSSKKGKSGMAHKKDDTGGHAIGIAEIDARLEALQKFMQDNMD